VGKERVEMRLGAEVQNLLIVRVIDVRKHPQELPVHRADRGGEGGVKRLICQSDLCWEEALERT